MVKTKLYREMFAENQFLRTACTTKAVEEFFAFGHSLRTMIKQALKWDISAGVALMRAPVIAPPMTDVERRYDEACHVMENELSLRSNFEIRAIKDKE
jgi:hypothetical protein